ncbi:MAG: hypothetical protein IT184_03745 [Acidobacteria bacterium]|nr:hypothetical protein [Acidobacteriota bacterium]
MKWLWATTVVCLGIWAAARAASPGVAPAVFFGMLGPLVAVAVTWVLVERAARVNPAATTGVMMTAFAAKMVFFAGYVVAVVLLAGVDRTVFGLSFAGYFIGLYAIEAVMLRRLMARMA